MRALLIVIDSFGVGALPDAHLYGDSGANTALHICQGVRQVHWPILKKLGLGNSTSILGHPLPGCDPVLQPTASYGVMAEASAGKDTTTGHWELAGTILHTPFTTFPLQYPSFPQKLTDNLQQLTGHNILGNRGASGTIIIEELGEAHLRGEGIIVYTSADSVLQIAAHEEIIPVGNLYSICAAARKLSDPYRIGRVIARPFTGLPGNFTRTEHRKDFSMAPPAETIFDLCQENGVETIAIGKIGDIFSERAINRSYHDKGNDACLNRIISCLGESSELPQLLFANLVDTDMLYGHRRDIQGYHDEIQKIDKKLAEIIDSMSEEDMLIITADHGCDPGFKGTDHTREYVPLIVYSKKQEPQNLGVRRCFCDVAQSLTTFFNISQMKNGESFIE